MSEIKQPCPTCQKEAHADQISKDPCECFHCSDCGKWVAWEDEQAWPGFKCPECGTPLG